MALPVERVAPLADELVATIRRAQVEDAVLLRDGRLPELRTSACDGERIDGHRLLLDAHHEVEAIGEQPANHALYQRSLFGFRRVGRNGVGGRLGLDVVRLAQAGMAGETRRGERQVVGIAHEQRRGQRARLEIAVRQHAQAHVARVAGRGGLDGDRLEGRRIQGRRLKDQREGREREEFCHIDDHYIDHRLHGKPTSIESRIQPASCVACTLMRSDSRPLSSVITRACEGSARYAS